MIVYTTLCWSRVPERIAVTMQWTMDPPGREGPAKLALS